MDPIITSLTVKVTCRRCERVSELVKSIDSEASTVDAELCSHEALDEAGWVDDFCPRCLDKTCGEPDRYREWVEQDLIDNLNQ